MRKTRVALATLLLAVVIFGCAQAVADGEHPPHTEHPAAGATAPAATSGADHPGHVIAWHQETTRADWYAGILEGEQREQQAMEAARAASAGRLQGPGTAAAGGGDCESLAAELGLSPAILWRESRCSTDAYNASGCGGRGCLGAAQVDSGHFAPVSPWNGNVPGSCYGLDPNDPGQYAECVSRLPASAWG